MSSRDDRYWEARLLSGRKNLTVLEKEQILENVLEKSTHSQNSRGRDWSFASRALAAVGVFVLLAIPMTIFLVGGPKENEFTARGAFESVPLFQLHCVTPNGKGTCNKGSKLVFRLDPPADKTHFAAFAKRASDGLIIWYFPVEEKGDSILIIKGGPNRILKQGILLDSNHRRDEYELNGLFAPKRLTRTKMRESEDKPYEEERGSYAIVHRKMIVELKP